MKKYITAAIEVLAIACEMIMNSETGPSSDSVRPPTIEGSGHRANDVENHDDGKLNYSVWDEEGV